MIKIFNHILQFLRILFRNFYLKPIALVRFIRNRKELCCHKSYFPDRKQKSYFRIFMEQTGQVLKYGYANDYYFPYGFDVKSKEEMAEYIHYSPFRMIRDAGNISKHALSAVLRDKQLFGMFTAYYGVRSAENLALTTQDGLFNLAIKSYQPINEFFDGLKYSDIFVKPVNGECGNGIYHITIADKKFIVNGQEKTIADIEKILLSDSYLIQATITQHEKMKSIHPQSLNTIRLVTIRNPRTRKIEVFPSIMRIGTGDAIVDNTSQGGLAVGIHLDSGHLMEYGFFKPLYGTKVNVHPDSGIRFSNFVIPYFEDCKRQALFLHSRLPNILSIGWDIAVDKDGPVFVEGNDNWEIIGPQICNGGLKSRYLKACGRE